MTYSEKLRDPRWQKKRLEIMQRDRFRCRECGNDKKTLNVHHEWYAPKKDPWDYPEEALSTYCEDCHEQRHSAVLGLMWAVSRLGNSSIGLVEIGILNILEATDPEEVHDQVLFWAHTAAQRDLIWEGERRHVAWRQIQEAGTELARRAKEAKEKLEQ